MPGEVTDGSSGKHPGDESRRRPGAPALSVNPSFQMDPVQEQLDAYNARDLERFLACYAPDVVIEDGLGNCLMAGIDTLRLRYGELFALSPALHAVVVSRLRLGDYVVDEERATGLNRPGASGDFHALVVYRVHAGRIAHVRMLR